MKTQTTKLPADSFNVSIVETCRIKVREEAVERYKNALENANKKWIFPPLQVWQDADINYLLDGQHRLLAAQQLSIESVPVNLQSFANLSEAHRFALHINSTNGERLSREETRANIRAYLQDGGAIHSDTMIANLFGVSRVLVSEIRANKDGMTKKEKAIVEVEKALSENPSASLSEISRKANLSRVTAKKIINRMSLGETKKGNKVLTDCFGREVPQDNIEKLARIQSSLKYSTSALNDFAKSIQDMMNAGAFAQTSEVEAIDNAVKQIRHILKQRRPDALCTCRGDGCRRCGGVGFLEKTMFNIIIPQTDK